MALVICYIPGADRALIMAVQPWPACQVFNWTGCSLWSQGHHLSLKLKTPKTRNRKMAAA